MPREASLRWTLMPCRKTKCRYRSRCAQRVAAAARIGFSTNLNAKGELTGDSLVITELDSRIMGGVLLGNARID